VPVATAGSIFTAVPKGSKELLQAVEMLLVQADRGELAEPAAVIAEAAKPRSANPILEPPGNDDYMYTDDDFDNLSEEEDSVQVHVAQPARAARAAEQDPAGKAERERVEAQVAEENWYAEERGSERQRIEPQQETLAAERDEQEQLLAKEREELRLMKLAAKREEEAMAEALAEAAVAEALAAVTAAVESGDRTKVAAAQKVLEEVAAATGTAVSASLRFFLGARAKQANRLEFLSLSRFLFRTCLATAFCAYSFQ
jgi:hypothetical protein